MAQYIKSEIEKYCVQDTINNFTMNYKKAVGLKCFPDITSGKGKLIGQVIYILNDQKFKLGDFVQFEEKRIKWNSTIVDSEGFHFYIAFPHYCKKHTSDPLIEVPVCVYNYKEDHIETERVKMNKDQYIKRKLLEFCGSWENRLVSAIDNYYVNKPEHGHYYALNMSVKHYHVTQEELKSALGKRNKKVSVIHRDWERLKIQYYENNQTQQKIAELILKNQSRKKKSTKKNSTKKSNTQKSTEDSLTLVN